MLVFVQVDVGENLLDVFHLYVVVIVVVLKKT